MYVEIEEILNSWKDANKYCDEYILTHKNDRDKIIKFISNYHSQIEEYQKALDETMSEKIDLEEENKKLQKENEELKQDNIVGCEKFIKQSQRIDKAIEYIKKEDELYYIKVFCRDLLKILGGE